MKKTKTKKFILIAVIGIVTIFAGGILFVSGMNNAGWDFKKLDREVLTEASFSTESEIGSVALEGGSWHYEIVRGEQFSIQYYESNLSEITVAENAGTVTLSEKQNGWNWFSMFSGIARGSVKVVVTVTGDINLKAQGSSTDVVAKGGFNFGNVTVEGSSADLIMENMDVAGAVTVKGSDADLIMEKVSVSGSIAVNGSSADAILKNVSVSGSITVDGSSADLIMENTDVAGAVTVKGSDAGAMLSGVSADSLSVYGSSADAFIKNSEIHGTLKMDGSSAEALIENSSVKTIDVIGSSGNVTARNADIGSLTGQGSSFHAELNLIGTKNDLLSVTATGSNAKVFIDGTKGDYNHGTGHKIFSAAGSSAKISINFLGGESKY